MEKKKNYIAPAVLDELLLEMEGQILVASQTEDPVEFQEVETMGQEYDDLNWTHTWE